MRLSEESHPGSNGECETRDPSSRLACTVLEIFSLGIDALDH